jgi:hypothetical protein
MFALSPPTGDSATEYLVFTAAAPPARRSGGTAAGAVSPPAGFDLKGAVAHAASSWTARRWPPWAGWTFAPTIRTGRFQSVGLSSGSELPETARTGLTSGSHRDGQPAAGYRTPPAPPRRRPRGRCAPQWPRQPSPDTPPGAAWVKQPGRGGHGHEVPPGLLRLQHDRVGPHRHQSSDADARNSSAVRPAWFTTDRHRAGQWSCWPAGQDVGWS